LYAKIGDPFLPMDFRQLLDKARQDDPINVDQAFRRIVEETTAHQLEELLSGLGLKPTDSEVYRRAFTMLALALCGVGQVAWTPRPGQAKGRWTPHNSATLFWLVRMLCEQESLTELGAIRRIASDKFLRKLLPYKRQDLRRPATLSTQERRFQTLRQAWMKIKPQSKQFLAAGPPQLTAAILGGQTGSWEAKLVAMDLDHALSHAGKNRAR
jgi:hypothetical protein